jgi:flagellar assembly protein FliH
MMPKPFSPNFGSKEVSPQSGEPKPYTFQDLGHLKKRDYAQIKKETGITASSDPERKARDQKSSRFALERSIVDSLGFEKEEQKLIEKEVATQLERLREEAKKDAEKIGYDQGLEKGVEKAYAQFKADADQRLQRLDRILEEFDGMKAALFQKNEKFFIDVAFQMAKMLALKEISADREYVLRLARQVFDETGIRENVCIQVHPRDLEAMEASREGIEKSLGSLKNLKIEASDEVEDGGVRIETEWNSIDASIATQLDRLQNAVQGTQSIEPRTGSN